MARWIPAKPGLGGTRWTASHELGTRYIHAFATTGTPADVTGIAANNKRLVGTVGQVALNTYWAAFLLDLP
jgi:hypothetical protein